MFLLVRGSHFKTMPRGALALLLILSAVVFLYGGEAKIVTRHYKRSAAGRHKRWTFLATVSDVPKEIDCSVYCMAIEHDRCGGYTFFP